MRHPLYEYKEVIGDSVDLYNQPAKIFTEVSWEFVADTLYNISHNIMQYKVYFHLLVDMDMYWNTWTNWNKIKYWSLIISISIVLTECCFLQLIINPVSDQGDSCKYWGHAARPVPYFWNGSGNMELLSPSHTGDSNEDVLVILFEGEWSSTVSLLK